MKKLSVLSSALVVSMLSFGAYAAVGDEVLDKDGSETCTVDVLGVSDDDDTAYVIAQWQQQGFNISGGFYPVWDSETEEYKDIECEGGFWCPGGEGTDVSGMKSQCPAEFPLSDPGSDSITDCYRNCDVSNSGIEHATSVAGKQYYSEQGYEDGKYPGCTVVACETDYIVNTAINMCEVTACPVGQHLEEVMAVVKKDPIVDIDPNISAGSYAAINGSGTYSDLGIEQKDSGLTDNNTWVHLFKEGLVSGRASCQSTVNVTREYFDGSYNDQTDTSNLDALIDGTINIVDIPEDIRNQITDLDFISSVLDGYKKGKINKTETYFALYSVLYSDKGVNYDTTSSGQYCFCQITGATLNGQTLSNVSNAPWVLHEIKFDSDSQCQESCSEYCAKYSVDNYPEMRGFVWALLDMFDRLEATNVCSANKIKIDWNPDNDGAHFENTCTYGGEITFPENDPVKPGHIFMGWKVDTTKLNATE